MLLFVIRHGDPVYQPDSLTPRGRMQAQALAKRFAVHGLDRIFSSPLIRAQETARPTAELLDLPVEIEEWTSETLAWEENSWTYNDTNSNATGFSYMVNRLYNNLYDVLVNGAEPVIKHEQVRKQVYIMEEAHKQNPLPKNKKSPRE